MLRKIFFLLLMGVVRCGVYGPLKTLYIRFVR